MADQDKQTDHLDEAKGQLEAGCHFLDEGNGGVGEAERRISIAGVHAAIAQAEQLERLCDLLDGTADKGAAVGVRGHVTTGAP